VWSLDAKEGTFRSPNATDFLCAAHLQPGSHCGLTFIGPMRRQTTGAAHISVRAMNRISEREEPAAAGGALESDEQRIVSMSPDGKTRASITVVLRRRIEALAQAIRDKNLEHLMSFYASDVTVFDLRPPLDVRGAAAYRKNFERWFASFEGPMGFEIKNLRIVPGNGAAFCHYLSLVSGARPGGRTSGYWVRGTTCFERRDDEWLVTHEHISMPAPV
jgi:ketosteroid isomerase-like protein